METQRSLNINDVLEWIEKYPYYANAHFILAKYCRENSLPEYTETLRIASAYAPDRKILKRFIETPVVEEKKSSADNISEQNHADELLEKFIAASPKLGDVKPQKFFNPVELARKSLAEDDTLISETLAKIHLEQNSFDRAIAMFEKLKLKYPEKFVYFDTLIEEARKRRAGK